MEPLLNLNEPAVDGEIASYVMLQKDDKPICRTTCINLPFEPPACWSISGFQSSKIYLQSELPQCRLYPEPENYNQRREWGRFLQFLWKNNVVAIVKFDICEFYILASNESPQFTHAVVPYYMRKGHIKSHGLVRNSGICQRELKSSIHSENQQKFCSQFGEGIDHSQGRRSRAADRLPPVVSDKKVNSSHELKVPLPTRDSSRSFTEALSVPIKPVKSVHKNFVRTDPSYLRTLSQTHAGWIFGAMAELVDNSKDAGAKRLDISITNLYSKKDEKRIPVLSVIDDGHGMHHTDIVRMVSFGHKLPNEGKQDHIGRFGIGFKTGAMKLGRDVLVLTQTSTSRSVAFLSESFNKDKENLEIPLITYCKKGHYMEVDLNIQSDATAEYNLNAIKEFSPFNEYFIGEKLGSFGEFGTGTQIYIWNLDRWGSESSDYTLEWDDAETNKSSQGFQSNIWIRSRRVRSRPGQISREVPLDYSLHAYLEVIFLDPRMKIYIQGSLVKSRPLAKSLNKTFVVQGNVKDVALQLTLGRSQVEWERLNCGIFLYWHGRLIEAYKRVGSMVHNADIGRGVIGVIDVTDLVDENRDQVWVLNNKQGFQDCEAYAELEDWLGVNATKYWDDNFDRIDLKKGGGKYEPDHEWVQCDKCRKWRILPCGFDATSLPPEWFCCMPPFKGLCDAPEEHMDRGVIAVSLKRSGYGTETLTAECNKSKPKKSKSTPVVSHEISKRTEGDVKRKPRNYHRGDSGEDSTETEDETYRPVLKRIRRGPPRSCKPS
ncbi:ATPase MORC2A-like isoform X1 [Dioscorea cayenensis subsp. rotundata]|uniref:ATPase MORC2A-like isoform X1 n=1 Tax=Dioscorea cayennensis subsp. rotundata TaxID=55577 RepID=A0AB40BCN3_DIOCR|nr:ATPase MORC2A-like isoform X1 [Dioscorea cayenensis subsp. rotundata]XP_039125086.1 ATPase MORC2A-like isoform X1 [Dioscorea cayenensis subsp. rotundata]